jgi:hypothetical protein
MGRGDQSTELTREELYAQVWTEPMTKLAQRYGLSECTTPSEISAKSRFVSNADLPGDLCCFSTPFQRDLSYCGDVSSLLTSPGNTAMTYCSTYIWRLG